MIIKFDISKKKTLNESKKSPNPKGQSNGVFKTDETTTVVNPQLGDSVIYKKMKGFITGAIGEQVIVSVQNSTYTCDMNSKDLKILNKKPSIAKPPFKFDEKTQKVLFEQYIKCGVYMNNVPVKTNDCYVKYSDWRDANMNEQINVMVEGQLNMMAREIIRIYEDVNDFANPEHYVDGVIIDETSGEVVENVKVNAEDYTMTHGDSDMVQIIRQHPGAEPELSEMPKVLLRTLSI
jgi:hypothetical protein